MKRNILVILAVFLLSVAARAQMIRFTEEEMVLGSENIVRGTVIKKRSYWNKRKSLIYTSVILKKDESIKGSAAEEIEVVYLGGKVGDITLKVSEMPTFTEGEKVLVFVRKNVLGDNVVLSGEYGKRVIREDSKGELDPGSKSFIRRVKKIVEDQK